MSQVALNDRVHRRSLELAAMTVDDEITPVEAGELRGHLERCPACSRRAAAMRADARALGEPLELRPSARVDDAVRAAIHGGRPRSVRLLVAAAIVVLLTTLGLLAVGGSLLRDREAAPTLPSPAPIPTSPAALATPTPAASAVAPGETWTTMTIPASDTGEGWIGDMRAVAGSESGFVAVGSPVCAPVQEPTACQASAWTASDNGAWTRAPDQPGLTIGVDAPIGGPEKGFIDVIAGPAGLVAIGNPYDQRGAGIWRSADGRTWERVEVDLGATPAEAYYARMVAVAANQQGYAIVGYVVNFVGPGPRAQARAAAWRSPDGVTWTRAIDTADMDVGPCVDTGEDPDCPRMRAVAPFESGFVAVGDVRSTPEPGVPGRPAAWTSRDGLTWTRSDAGLDFAGRLDAVAVGAPGIVAAGRFCVEARCSGVDAFSADGNTWAYVPVDGTPSEQSRLASDGGVVLGIGFNRDDAGLHIWRIMEPVLAPGQEAETLPTLLRREPIETPALPDNIQGFGEADVAVLGDRAVIVAWARLNIPHDSGLPPTMNLAFQSP